MKNKPWFKRKVEVPGETIYEIITEEDDLGFGLALAEIHESKKHVHHRTKEFYFVVEGSLSLTVGKQVITLNPFESYSISPNQQHHAKKKGKKAAKVLVLTSPAWSMEDHHLIEEAAKEI